MGPFLSRVRRLVSVLRLRDRRAASLKCVSVSVSVNVSVSGRYVNVSVSAHLCSAAFTPYFNRHARGG